MRSCLWLSLLCITGACKPQRDTAKKQLQLTTAPTAALTEAGLQTTSSERDVLATVAKAIIGLNAGLDDRHDHIGLANVAALVGYDLPLNDCGTPWTVSSEGTGSAFTLVISSRHDRGVGPRCREADAEAPVRYLFKNWSVHQEAVSWVPFKASGTIAEVPAWLGQSNGKDLKAVTAGIDGQGRRYWTSQEAIESSNPTQPDGQPLVLQYHRTIPATGLIQAVDHQRSGYGLAATAKAGATLDPQVSFSAGALPAPQLKWATAECNATITVPSGCQLKASITVQLKQTVGRLKADLQVAPKTVGLRGRLGSEAPCHHLALRKDDGSCGGSMGPEGKGVEAWFGQSSIGFTFAQELAAQASSRQSDSAGDWDFAAMRLLPGQQSQGIPTIDWALRYFQLATYAKTTVQFEQSDERIESCQLHVEALPGSSAACAAAVVDRTIEPVRRDAEL